MKTGIMRFLRCAGKAVLPKVPKWIAKAMGLDLVGDMMEVGEEFYKNWRAETSEAQARAELQAVAQPLPPAQLKQAVNEVVLELAADQTAEVQRGLTQYLLQIPSATRQALRRPADPSGTTVPATLPLKKVADVVGLLPFGLAQFQAGERPGCLHGDWELVELLGRGGQGEVWKACRIDDREFVSAFKFCTDPDSKRQLQLAHEKSIVQRVKKANLKGVVTLEDYKLDGTPPWLRYELIEGGDLAGLVHEWSEQPELNRTALATSITQRLARIVGQFHRLPDPHQVVHRDLKPANILVRRMPHDPTNHQFLVADFGIGHITARRALDQARIPTLAPKSLGTLRYACTPLYASPQQQRGDDPDVRDDVFALGVIWYQLMLRDLSKGAPTGLGWDKRLRGLGLGDGHIQLLGECLAEDPADRPRDAQHLYEQLAALAGEPIVHAARPVEPVSPPSAPVAVAPAPQVVVPRQKPGILVCTGPNGADAARVKKAQKDWADFLGVPVLHTLDLGSGVKLEMLLVPPGRFMMGSPDNESERNSVEKLHEVELTKPFYLGKFPVTQEQYEQALQVTNPSYFSSVGGGKDSVKSLDTRRFPVEQVSSGDAEAFCSVLGANMGVENFTRFQLPTEAQWEYACRAGTRTRFHVGNELSPTQANFNNSLKRTSDVSAFSKFANALGLVDMHGNIWEWCKDYYDESLYNYNQSMRDPVCNNGSFRVHRGGGWSGGAGGRSASRRAYVPDGRGSDLGFRLALVPGPD